MQTNLWDKVISLIVMVLGLGYLQVSGGNGLNLYLGLTITLGGLLTLVGAHTLSTIMSVAERGFLASSANNAGSANKSL